MVAESPDALYITISFLSSACDILSILYVFLKTYRIVCFTKLTFDQLPLFNPYRWPLSIIRLLTKPYFKFWSKLIPAVKVGRGSYDISSIVGLEVLSSLSVFFFQMKINLLAEMEKLIANLN